MSYGAYLSPQHFGPTGYEVPPPLRACAKQPSLGRLGSALVGKIGLSILAAFQLLALRPEAKGSAIVDEARLPGAQALGEAQDETVFFEATLNGNLYHASGILVRGETHDWVITAAHLLKGTSWLVDISTITIGNGPNYIDPVRRGVTSGVSEMIIPQIWNPGNSKATEDWGFLRLANRISTPALVFQIGPVASERDQLLLTSYSIPFSIATGQALPINGNVMSITGAYSEAQPASWNDPIYSSARFEGALTSGYETNGGSGGSVKLWNGATSRYEQYGMTVGGNPNTQATFFLDFHAPGVAATINAIIRPAPPPVPELQVTQVGTAIRLTWDAAAAGFRVKTSDDLSIWRDLGGVLTGPGTYDDPIDNRPSQFYRLVKP